MTQWYACTLCMYTFELSDAIPPTVPCPACGRSSWAGAVFPSSALRSPSAPGVPAVGARIRFIMPPRAGLGVGTVEGTTECGALKVRFATPPGDPHSGLWLLMPFEVEPARLEDDEPCGHPGCLHHVSHPCEGCGRIAGRAPAPASE